TNFSGGQKQLLAIARTLLSKAEILIFDEVTSSLDPLLVEKIKDIFENLKLDHTIIIVTHSPIVAKAADEVFELLPAIKKKPLLPLNQPIHTQVQV
ncbi:MAG: AAA family ATPase, partial [Clostridia bacterium]